MINILNKSSKLGLIILISLSLVSIKIYSKETKFELKKPAIPSKSTIEEKPLFDLLNSNQPLLQSNNNSTRWGNNPFFKRTIESEKTKGIIEPKEQEINFFEYKISAIWKVKNEYKALISGHIVKKGDQINDLKILRINKDKVVIKRNNRKKVFRIGNIFYDFQI